MKLTKTQLRIVKSNTDAARLVAKALIGLDDNCWPWVGNCNENGYGTFYFRGKTWKAHRASYAIFCGEIPSGLFVCHHCDNPPCVNPSHLFLGHANVNMKDMVRKGRAGHLISSDQRHFKTGRAPNGELASGHKLSEADAKDIIRSAASGALTSDIAYHYQIQRSTVQRILRGETWSHLPRPAGLPRTGGRYRTAGRAALEQEGK